MRLKQIIKEYFNYSKSEQNGLIILLVLLFSILIISEILDSKEDDQAFFERKEQSYLDSLMQSIETKSVTKNRDSLFFFNPNIANKLTLSKLGFNDFQINNILKYRLKGGWFYRKSDLMKIYGIHKSEYNRVLAYIKIDSKKTIIKENFNKIEVVDKYFYFDPNTISPLIWDSFGVSRKISYRIQKYLATGARFQTPSDLRKIYGFDSLKLNRLIPFVSIKASVQNKDSLQSVPLLDLNLADTNQLKRLPGIGSVLSSRIVKYKKVLGGYIEKRQLLEVYGISKSEYERIKNFITIDIHDISYLNLNSIHLDQLKKHPYISNRLALDIIRYRDRNGKYKRKEELLSKRIVDDSIYKKIVPYLRLN
ncbi:helix-hairpin-helix domain-containing protein [Ancylomarina longa]|uniref:Helix-hairpin-helix domain-containing protein n=1 Tax=Ancylomarina longa TaxID=2487017 RepID=A0A434ATS9_9BACT|nr:helix-hairpin-helix domain-containing protein [Ancylomarina longa]RUT77823.1 hypothetical protein DLK05_11545 [Ancylomarina longa]